MSSVIVEFDYHKKQKVLKTPKGIIGQTNGMHNSNELAPVQDSEACTTAQEI